VIGNGVLEVTPPFARDLTSAVAECQPVHVPVSDVSDVTENLFSLKPRLAFPFSPPCQILKISQCQAGVPRE
jgi:hypothetical protein